MKRCWLMKLVNETGLVEWGETNDTVNGLPQYGVGNAECGEYASPGACGKKAPCKDPMYVCTCVRWASERTN